MAPKKRRLGDLYRRGKELTLGDGEGEPIVVWIQKLNPLDHEAALRKANAKRAAVLLVKRDHESEEYLSAYNDATDFGDAEALIDYLVESDLVERAEAIQSETAAEDKWSDDNMLQGLRDAWADGLEASYHSEDEDDRDPEAVRVFTALKEFSTIVEARIDQQRVALKRDYEGWGLERLRDVVTDKFIETRANSVWLTEYQRCLVFLGTRELDDHAKYYFTGRQEVDELEPQVLRPLTDAYEELIVDIQEGKGSPQTTDSSASSERSEEAATDAPSGRMAAAL